MNNDSLYINRQFGAIRTSVLLIFALILAFSANLSAQSLSLEDAIKTAKARNEKIKQYAERVEQKKADDKVALGNFLPSLRLQANYNHLNDPLEIDLDPIRQAIIQIQAGNQTEFANIYSILQGNSALTAEQRAALYAQYGAQLGQLIPPFREILKNQDYRVASLVLVQPLFLGGRLIAAKKFAAADQRAAEAELTKTENEVIQETVNNYLAVALLNQVVDVRRQVLEGMKQHRDQARKLFDEGLIARYHFLRAEVAVADAERNLFDDSNRRDLALIALKQTLGLDHNAAISVSDSLAYGSLSDTLSQFLAKAQTSQPLLELLREKKQAANQKFNAERAEFLPQLSAFGKYEMIPEDLSALEPRWVVGLQMNMTILEGGKRYHRLESARHLQKEVDYLQAYTKRQIDLWVEKSYREMRNAEERYLKLKANVELAQENLRQGEKRFETGLGTSLEVVDARLELEKNLLERLSSLREYYRALTDLFVAAGQPQQIIEVWKDREN